jgi:soluble lytic murein transglycosylase-like protein
MRRERLVRTAAASLLAVAAGLVAATASSAHSRHQVQAGETLSELAIRFGTTVRRLARINRLRDPDHLLAGSTLLIPSSPGRAFVRYRVRRGDTVTTIAARYGTTVAAIVRANRLDNPGVIYAGSSLLVPAQMQRARVADRQAVLRAIDQWARRYGIDRHLARAVAWMESGFKPGAVSPAGAWGVMQVMPATWKFVENRVLGVRAPRTTNGNIRVGIAYLSHLLRVFGGNKRLAVAAYFQGPTSVRSKGMHPRTRAYVADVLALEQRFRRH